MSSFSDPRAHAWNQAMAASPGSLDVTIDAAQIEGQVPVALRGGRMLSNGPGWTRIGGRTAHPFDGHGYVRSFQLMADGSCTLKARFVETAVYKDEAAAGRMLHRGFATNVSDSFWKNLGFGTPRNVANTTILRWGKRLLAGWEGGSPYALDPQSLETLGEDSFDGVITGQATLAHMHHDATRGRLLLCSPGMGRNTTLTFREIDCDRRLVQTRRATLPGSVFAHDFAFTPHWYILGGNPLQMKWGALARMVAGSGTLLNSVRPDDAKPGMFYLVPREEDGPVRTILLPDKCFVVHFANAFERDDGTVVIDVCAFARFDFGEEFGYTGPNTPFDPSLPDARGPQRLYRATIAPGATSATWERLAPYGVDFPRVHPQQEGQDTPVLFGATRADTRFSDPFDSVVRVDLHDRSAPPQLWTAPAGSFVGEPIYVPHADGGHVLVIVSDPLQNRSTLAILQAGKLDAGPVARIHVPLLPMAFHGDWDPA
jgi:all-trans-8'-apo-beta-carotenal 15,15'-oxygenase